MTEKIPSLKESSKERLLFICKNLQNLAKYHENKIAKVRIESREIRENTELRSRDYIVFLILNNSFLKLFN